MDCRNHKRRRTCVLPSPGRRALLDASSRRRRVAALKASASRSDWSSLTEPLLQSILDRLLLDPQDVVAFHAVCRHWRSISAPVFQFPLVLITKPRPAFHLFSQKRLFEPPDLSIVLSNRRPIGFYHGYLLLASTRNRYYDKRPAKLLLYNPITGAKLRTASIHGHFTSAVLHSDSPDSIELLLLDDSFRLDNKTLHYCRFQGNQFSEERKIEIEHSIFDMILVGRRVYMLTRDGMLGTLDDLAAPSSNFELLEGPQGRLRKYSWRQKNWNGCFLAKSGDDLLLVKEKGVWRWDTVRRRRVKVESLGGRALLMGAQGFVASIEPPVDSELKPDCVYYPSGYRFPSNDTSTDSTFFKENEDCYETNQWAFSSLKDGKVFPFSLV